MKPLTLAFAFLLMTTTAWAEDARHTVKPANGKPYESSWWESLAHCAGKIQVLGKWASDQNKPEAAALQNGTNVLWSLAIARLMKDRGIAQDEAQKIAIDTVRSAAQLQQQGILIYGATGKMDEEFSRQISDCDHVIHEYSTEFPDAISQ